MGLIGIFNVACTAKYHMEFEVAWLNMKKLEKNTWEVICHWESTSEGFSA